MFCPRCRANVANGKSFCGDCGSPLPVECSACGNENPAGKKFCADCGASLVAKSSDAPDSAAAWNRQHVAERRQLTVMFVDLVGSTMLGTQLDPEDLREVIVAYQGCITSIVARFDGFVARYMGDGALVYFGHPNSHEDDAERAINAALAIVEAVSHLKTVAGPAGFLACRVGIATGPVVVGDVIGYGSSRESPVVGDTPNFAAGLITMAEPSMVAIAETTRSLTGELFTYKVLGPGRLKGSPTPVYAWAVLSARQIESRFEALRSGNLPLLGRTEELELLLRRWDQAKAGQGGVVFLTGEPGIGKSRLVVALEHRMDQATCKQVRCVCSPHHQDSTLHPIIRRIERDANFERSDSPAEKLGKLARLFDADTRSAADAAVVADLLSIPRLKQTSSEIELPQRSRDVVFDTILRYFERQARQNSLLVVFEDIHWADTTTLDVLQRLVARVEHLPIMLVVTARPEFKAPWATRPQVTVRLLSGLHLREAAALVKAVVADRVLSDDVVDRIVARADGIPLFIEELTKVVLEARRPNENGQRPVLAEPHGSEIVPTTLQASLMARLDRLAAGKQVAQIGSVIGREFSFELLHGLTRLPQTYLEEALNELVQTGLAIASGLPPHSTYAFKHALVQDTAYASMLRERRRTLHLSLAELLERDGFRPEATLPEVIAWHFAEAGTANKSIDYYLKAAERTTGRFALAEKVSHLRKALRQIERLPKSTDTMRRELSLQVALGQALIDAQGSGTDEMRAAFERARVLCLELDDIGELLRAHDGLLNYHFSHAEPEQALRYANEMLDVGARTGHRQAFLMARKSAGFAHLLLGRFETACTDMQSVLDTYDGEMDGPQAALTTRDTKMGAYTVLGICLTALGHLDAGAAKSQKAIKYAETLNHPVSQIVALRRACVQSMMQRDTRTVLRLSERLLRLANEFETFKGSRDGTLFHCWAQLQTRCEPAVVEHMESCIEQFDSTKHWAMLPFFMCSTAEVKGRYGDLSGAAVLLNRAADLVQITGERWAEAELFRLQACFGTRDFDDAVSLLRTSMDKAGQQQAKLWELRAATSLANLWLEHGHRAAAREVLAPIYAWFTEGLETPDLVASRALLDQMGCDAKSVA